MSAVRISNPASAVLLSASARVIGAGQMARYPQQPSRTKWLLCQVLFQARRQSYNRTTGALLDPLLGALDGKDKPSVLAVMDVHTWAKSAPAGEKGLHLKPHAVRMQHLWHVH